VINIESSHCYPSLPRFLAEVARVLRPGGHFLYADLRPRVCIAEWEAALADAPMRRLSHADIDTQVARGMEKSSQRTPEAIDRREPAYLHGVAREATASQGSGLYRAVRGGDFSYRMYCFVKD
jgi:SAM-dependent methyltransferase